MPSTDQMLFDERFLDKYAGETLLNNPVNAVLELIANAWDALATEVKITWPDEKKNQVFTIEDNGTGMTEDEFNNRWKKLAYNRQKEQGEYAYFENDINLPRRRVFGQNGKGRFAAFCFGHEYIVKTSSRGKEIEYLVKRHPEIPIILEKLGEKKKTKSGTEIIARDPKPCSITLNMIREEVSLRFLHDPNFGIWFDCEKLTPVNIPQKKLTTKLLKLSGIGEIKIEMLSTMQTDRTMRFHGIGWRVNDRLVGDVAWKGSGHENLIDGRRIGAKKHLFIVYADCLHQAVLPDWSGFNQNDVIFQRVKEEVDKYISSKLYEFINKQKSNTYKTIVNSSKAELLQMRIISKDNWQRFIIEVQDECPSITVPELKKLADILAKLEISKNQYGLLDKLAGLDTNQLDDLYKIMDDWTIEMAKIVLDEIQQRIHLLELLSEKIKNKQTNEVLELQPLFKKGLWIFGPEYETIHYTANEGMTAVIQKIFGKDVKGSPIRPDFVILPDSSVGLYSYASYDEEGSESGIERLTIVELKAPKLTIGRNAKNQCRDYVQELFKKGMLHQTKKIMCYPLGSQIDPIEAGESTDKISGTEVLIRPLLYDTVIQRAKSRLFNLSDKVKNAPCFNEKQKKELNGFLKGDLKIAESFLNFDITR